LQKRPWFKKSNIRPSIREHALLRVHRGELEMATAESGRDLASFARVLASAGLPFFD